MSWSDLMNISSVHPWYFSFSSNFYDSSRTVMSKWIWNWNSSREQIKKKIDFDFLDINRYHDDDKQKICKHFLISENISMPSRKRRQTRKLLFEFLFRCFSWIFSDEISGELFIIKIASSNRIRTRRAINWNRSILHILRGTLA